MPEKGLAIKSVVKAVEILEQVMASPDGSTLKALSSALELNSSTAHHLADTLRQTGLLQQDPDTKAYRLGVKAFQMGQAALQHLDLARRAQPFIRQMAQETGEGVSLVEYSSGTPVHVLQLDSTRSLGMRHRPSAAIHLHASASGKIFLSSLSDDELRQRASALALPALTPGTITEQERLLKEIRKVRKQGYAVDSEEVEEGLVCIAAPIRNLDGGIIGSISLSGPSIRVANQREALIDRICEVARSVSYR